MNRVLLTFFTGLLVFHGISLPAFAKQKVVYKWGFENGIENWKALYYNAANKKTTRKKVTTSNTAKYVKSGIGALHLDYETRPFHVFAMYRRVKIPKQYKELSFKFWIKSSRSSQFLVTLEEKDGSSYEHLLDLDRVGKWNYIKLSSKDFKLERKNNRDENGHLDLNQIKQISIIDFTGLFSKKVSKTAASIDKFQIKGILGKQKR